MGAPRASAPNTSIPAVIQSSIVQVLALSRPGIMVGSFAA
jgi:hypothetical protein